MLVDELLVVGDQGLGDRLADGVDLGGVATAADADADVDVGELVEAEDEERLVDLEGELVPRFFSYPNPPRSTRACVVDLPVPPENCGVSYLESKSRRLNERQRAAVDLDEALAGLENFHRQYFDSPSITTPAPSDNSQVS